jgi:hypothetical protein
MGNGAKTAWLAGRVEDIVSTVQSSLAKKAGSKKKYFQRERTKRHKEPSSPSGSGWGRMQKVHSKVVRSGQPVAVLLVSSRFGHGRARPRHSAGSVTEQGIASNCKLSTSSLEALPGFMGAGG